MIFDFNKINLIYNQAKENVDRITKILESDFALDEKHFSEIYLDWLKTDRTEFISNFKENQIGVLMYVQAELSYIHHLVLTLEDNYLKELNFSADELIEFLFGDVNLLIEDLKRDMGTDIKNYFHKNGKLRISKTESSLKRLEFAPFYLSLLKAEIFPDQRKNFSDFLVTMGIFESGSTTAKLFSEFNDQSDASKGLM